MDTDFHGNDKKSYDNNHKNNGNSYDDDDNNHKNNVNYNNGDGSSNNNNSNNNNSMTNNSMTNNSMTNPPMRIVWRNVIIMAALHLVAVYAFCFQLRLSKWPTLLWAYFLLMYSGVGITCGAHRLWAHRSYKAKLPLRLLLVVAQTIAIQNSVIEWARDHRVHHKFSETNADPHNAKRGFFFSHVGWLMVKKHPEVKSKGKGVDMSDLESDSILAFQKKFYVTFVLFAFFIAPSAIPWLFWGESWLNAFYVAGILRLVSCWNCTWTVNSLAHLIGTRPYEKTHNSAENLFVVWAAVGEGFHNYHHSFPHDYSISETNIKGFSLFFNFGTVFIDLMAFFGLAYDRRKIKDQLVKDKQKNQGDGNDYLQFFNPFRWTLRT